MRSRTLVAGSMLAAVLLALGLADFFLQEQPALLALRELRTQQPPTEPGDVSPEEEEEMPGNIVIKGVARRDGPNVREVLLEHGYSWTEAGSSEPRLLMAVAPAESMQVLGLLKDDDRAAFLGWIEDPDAKELLLELKGLLQRQFSPNVSDLMDESLYPEEGAPRDILSFRDPSLLPERVVFVRVRTRLYEFHVPEEREGEIAELIEELAR